MTKLRFQLASQYTKANVHSDMEMRSCDDPGPLVI